MENKEQICYDRYTLQEFCLSADISDCAKKISNLLIQQVGTWICPILLHTFVPYYLTLKKGGRFTWMRNKNEVIVQCPQVKNPCIVKLKRICSGGMDKKIQAKILDINLNCSLTLQKNQAIVLEDIFSEESCLLGFDNAFPYIEYIRRTDVERVSFFCSCQKKSSIINLRNNSPRNLQETI